MTPSSLLAVSFMPSLAPAERASSHGEAFERKVAGLAAVALLIFATVAPFVLH